MNHTNSSLSDRTLAALWATALQLVILSLLALAMPAAQALTLDEVGTGELLFKGTGQHNWNPAPQLGTTVDIQVSGLVARVTVEQRFRNPGSDWTEARYVFPLPETAAVNDMRIRIDAEATTGKNWSETH